MAIPTTNEVRAAYAWYYPDVTETEARQREIDFDKWLDRMLEAEHAI